MQPSQSLATQVSTLLGADTTTLAAATALKLHLAQAAFTPALSLTVASFTEATFTGYAALAAGATGTQTSYLDPATGNTFLEIKPPVGGWLFKTTSAAGLPQTIYGYYLTDSTSATLYGSALLSAPVILTLSGQGIEVPNARFVFPPSPMS